MNSTKALGFTAVFLQFVAAAAWADLPFKNVTQVSVGGAHICATRSSGEARCWGYNGEGQLGVGDNRTPDNFDYFPRQVFVSGATAISAGGGYQSGYTCALLSGGDVKCWGHNDSGQLGTGNTSDLSSPPATPVLSGATEIAAGGIHTCALLVGGDVKCWGWNGYGQLGNGNRTNLLSPPASPILSGATAIATGSSHTCALLSGGDVKCWGHNDRGQLGTGNTTDLSSPPASPILSGVAAIAARGAHTCALLVGGDVKCWGLNGEGQLGTGNTNNLLSPPAVPVLSGAIGVAAGGSGTCALLSGGDVKCWGRFGLLGVFPLSPPVTPTVSGATAISAAGLQMCALKNDTSVFCQGNNGFRGYEGGYSGTVMLQSPLVANVSAAGATSTSVVMTASVNPRWNATKLVFEFGTTTAYGGTASEVDAGSGIFSIPLGINVNGLLCGTVYHFRAVATSEGGPAVGTDASFTTADCQPRITSENTASFMLKAAGAFSFQVTGDPLPTVSISGALPSDLTFDSGTRRIIGTPASGTAGSYPLVITAANGRTPDATQNFSLKVFEGQVYIPVTPCRFVDGINAGDRVLAAPNSTVPRYYRVRGSVSSDFVSQGAGATASSGCGVPANATAVMVNLTVADPDASGDLRVDPAHLAQPSLTSVLNYTFGGQRGKNLANGVIVALCDQSVSSCGSGTSPKDPTRDMMVTFHAGGTAVNTFFLADVLGYFAPASLAAAGRAYTPVTPCRFVDGINADDRVSAAPNSTTKRFYTVRGAASSDFVSQGAAGTAPSGCNVAGDATAVMVNLTVADPDNDGDLKVDPSHLTEPSQTSVLNYTFGGQRGKNLANGVIVSLCDKAQNACAPAASPKDPTRDMMVTFHAGDKPVSTYFLADALGYFGPAATQMYAPVTPCRFVDGLNAGDRVSASTNGTVKRYYRVRGNVPSDFVSQGAASAPKGCGVPSNATAVMVNLTVVDPDAEGDLKVDPAHLAQPSQTSLLNYTFGSDRGKNLANGVIVPLCDLSASSCSSGTTPQGPTRDMMVTFHAGPSSLRTSTYFLADVLGYFVPTVP
jgi:hypothetical protein